MTRWQCTTCEPRNISGSCRCIQRMSCIGQRISRWLHLILSRVLQRRASHRDSTSCTWISTQAEFLLDAWVTLVLSYLLGCCSVGSLKETALLDLGNRRCRVSPRRQGSPSAELSIDSALSLLITLEAAQQGRRVLFSDDQRLLFEGWKKGFVKNTKLDFYKTLIKPRMRVI